MRRICSDKARSLRRYRIHVFLFCMIDPRAFGFVD